MSLENLFNLNLILITNKCNFKKVCNKEIVEIATNLLII